MRLICLKNYSFAFSARNSTLSKKFSCFSASKTKASDSFNPTSLVFSDQKQARTVWGGL